MLLCILLNAWVGISIAKLHVFAALAFVGLLVVTAGGVSALIAILRHGERSAGLFGALALSVFAFLVVVAQLGFDVP